MAKYTNENHDNFSFDQMIPRVIFYKNSDFHFYYTCDTTTIVCTTCDT